MSVSGLKDIGTNNQVIGRPGIESFCYKKQQKLEEISKRFSDSFKNIPCNEEQKVKLMKDCYFWLCKCIEEIDKINNYQNLKATVKDILIIVSTSHLKPDKTTNELTPQKRSCGNFYFNHLARPLFSFIREIVELKKFDPNLDPITLAESIVFHDIIEEDLGITPEYLAENFGKETSFLVQGVTKIADKDSPREQKSFINIKNLLTFTGSNYKVLVTKLYDHRDNMRTIPYILDKSRRARMLLESLRFYIPLAEIFSSLSINSNPNQLGFRQFREIKIVVFEEIEKLIKDPEVNPDQEEFVALFEKYKQYKDVYSKERFIKTTGPEDRMQYIQNLAKNIANSYNSASDIENFLFKKVNSLDLQKIPDVWVPFTENSGLEKMYFKRWILLPTKQINTSLEHNKTIFFSNLAKLLQSRMINASKEDLQEVKNIFFKQVD